MKELKLFTIGPDILSAYDAEDAKKLVMETYGYSADGFEDEEIVEMSEYEHVTVTWQDGDFECSIKGKDYPDLATVEFVAVYINPWNGSAGVPRFELKEVSYKDGHIRVGAQAKQWAKLGRKVVAGSEY